MREMCMSGSTSGMWKRGTVWIMRHRQTKEPDTDRPSLNYRATSRLYKFSTFHSVFVYIGSRDSEDNETADTGDDNWV